MKWYEKAIYEWTKEIYIKALYPFLAIAVAILANWLFSWNFQWQEVDVLEPIFSKAFYSGFAFISVWAVWYKLRLWQVLYNTVGKLFWYSFYKKVKKWLWQILIVLWFILLYIIFQIINWFIELWYNLFNFLVYLAPILGIPLIMIGVFLIGKEYIKHGSIVISSK